MVSGFGGKRVQRAGELVLSYLERTSRVPPRLCEGCDRGLVLFEQHEESFDCRVLMLRDPVDGAVRAWQGGCPRREIVRKLVLEFRHVWIPPQLAADALFAEIDTGVESA